MYVLEYLTIFHVRFYISFAGSKQSFKFNAFEKEPLFSATYVSKKNDINITQTTTPQQCPEPISLPATHPIMQIQQKKKMEMLYPPPISEKLLKFDETKKKKYTYNYCDNNNNNDNDNN